MIFCIDLFMTIACAMAVGLSQFRQLSAKE